ncbi:MAG: cytochrome c biogenesis protein ResB [Chloroflexi bacterium]|nr:MAG: cytochrome c biogenesis protein ResB [Chloroflexota bacterium]
MPAPMASLHLRARAAAFWREYTRMRTAILFLIGVALIVLVGCLPLTQVFVSPLFLGLLASLYLALGACVIRRARALALRTARGYPRTPQFWGEWGSWLFHASFFLLLVAVLYGKSTGFEGLMTVTEGQRVTEARGSFDQLKQGLLFDGHHSGFDVQLNRFSATYAASGAPTDFVSDVTVYDHGQPVLRKNIRVNDFLEYNGVDYYQQDYGWAPHLVVRNPAGQVVFDSPVQVFGEDKSQETGALKVPDFGYTLPATTVPVQIGANLTVYPDARTIARLGSDGSIAGSTAGPGGQEARNPVVMLGLFVGDLGLSAGAPQNVNDLDTARMQPYFADGHAVALSLGQSLQLPLHGGDCTDPQASGCFTVSFSELRQYSLFQVKKDSGVPFVYVTFGLIMLGLLTKLYARPLLEARQRRLRVAPPGGAQAAATDHAMAEPVGAGTGRDPDSGVAGVGRR